MQIRIQAAAESNIGQVRQSNEDAFGFDLDLGPVADVCNGQSSIMWGRCYGTSPAPVASDLRND